MLRARGEATNINFRAFGLTRPGLETTIYRIRGEHANYYPTGAVQFESNAEYNSYIVISKNS